MKRIVAICLFAMFLTGVFFPSCDGFRGCDFAPVARYFDIRGVGVQHFSDYSIFQGDSLLLKDYQVYMYMIADYYGKSPPPKGSFFSPFLQAAYACSPPIPGAGGTDEKVTSLTFITLNDFDSTFMANDTINELIIPEQVGDNSVKDIEGLLGYFEERWYWDQMFFTLKRKPRLNKEFKVSIHLTLDNGESYDAESEGLILY